MLCHPGELHTLAVGLNLQFGKRRRLNGTVVEAFPLPKAILMLILDFAFPRDIVKIIMRKFKYRTTFHYISARGKDCYIGIKSCAPNYEPRMDRKRTRGFRDKDITVISAPIQDWSYPVRNSLRFNTGEKTRFMTIGDSGVAMANPSCASLQVCYDHEMLEFMAALYTYAYTRIHPDKLCENGIEPNIIQTRNRLIRTYRAAEKLAASNGRYTECCECNLKSVKDAHQFRSREPNTLVPAICRVCERNTEHMLRVKMFTVDLL